MRGPLQVGAAARSGDVLLWIGAMLVLLPTLLRLVVAIDPMPAWGTDLLVMWIPPAGLGAFGTLMLDVLTVLGAGVVLAATPVHGRVSVVALTVIGSVGVLVHALRDEAHAVSGMPWVASMCTAIAMMHLPRRSAIRLAGTAAMLGLSAMLGAKAVVQVFVEHPATVASYEQSREAFLASRGWSPDSVMARNYERRLYQPEATGWFGLSNVFGSLAAAWLLALGSAAILAVRERLPDRRVLLLLGLGAIVSAGALVLSFSRGAVGALLVGVAALVVVMRLPRRAGLLCALVPVAVLVGVVVRGILGERIGELSILFRWFYIQGATGIFLDHPIAGVGPAGFKNAYMLAKPAISPEEVSSPHSIFFDWLACLGLLGLAWVVLIGFLCRAIGCMVERQAPAPPAPPPVDDPGSARVAALASAGLVAMAVAGSAYFERALLTPEMGLARAFGLLAGLGVAWAVTRAADRSIRVVEVGLIGAGLALLAHTQIETTLVSPGAAPAAGALLGLACLPPSRPRGARANPIAGVGVLMVGVVSAVLALPSLWTWSRALDRATAAVRPFGQWMSAFESAERGSAEQAEAVRALARLAGLPEPRSAEQAAVALSRARQAAGAAALPGLRDAARARPLDLPTREALVRMLVGFSQVSEIEGPALAREALEAAEQAAAMAPRSAQAWGLVANTHLALLGTSLQAGVEPAIEACRRAASLDPHGLNYPLRLVDLLGRAGLVEEQRAWAGRALEIDADLRLDPLRQLTPEQKSFLERLAAP
ncbi:MAG: O-antigen ligase family protein [Phycisphaerales bacterium]|nr:O-antigen ligase family protein [Phycisphaerales bacterium]